MDTARLNQFNLVFSLSALENYKFRVLLQNTDIRVTCFTIVSDKVNFVTAAVYMLPCLC